MCKKLPAVLLGILCVSAPLRLTAPAQVRPVYDRGAVGLMQLLKRLNTTASALMIGAHPDDEDTALLAYLARGENARTAYLSLTRGDGGQNIIGPELGEALGVIRTEELLQARRLDGAEQFFTRAYDFGFSKTLEEARAKWDEKIILCDAVRVIRNFRPLVFISQFSGTPADGHGQHQFAGYIAPLAVKAAADQLQCTDAGSAWQVKKFYVRHRGTGEPTLRINTGKYDPLLGRSYFEIAMEARSQHKSQEQGVLELKGDQFSQLNLIGGEERNESFFSGIETEAKDEFALRSFAEFDPRSPAGILPLLVKGYAAAQQSGNAMRQKLFAEAIKLAAGIQIDAISDRETVTPGEDFLVSVRSFLASKDVVSVRSAEVIVPEGWSVAAAAAPPAPAQGFFRRETGDHAAYFRVAVPDNANARPTSPYWLIDLRAGDMFRWYGGPATRPFSPEMPRAKITADVLGTELAFDAPVEYRFADDVRGEIRRNVNVVPTVSVEVDQPLLIIPQSIRQQKRRLTVSITNHALKPVTGKAYLSFETNSEWISVPKERPFELSRPGEKLSVEFEVTIPANARPGSYKIAPVGDIGGSFAPPSMKLIAYPHIQTHRFYRRTLTDAQVFDLRTTPAKIGYITGSGDRVQDAIKQMGFDVETISESELARGNLAKYDTIVVGIRAFQVRPDVVANNRRLLDYARNGGTLIVQYQLPGYAPLAPFTTQMGPRVVDENAAVNIVDPKHPIFDFPNKITAKDFEGWVQERNLYNFTNFGAEYTGLLEAHDAGEAENKGGLVIAKLGKGNYLYCSYSMFRQLPAGVPGAYRLFANLVSLPKSQNRLR